MTVWNEEGPVYGPNGEYELDSDNQLCRLALTVFSTCKNSCPGGELLVISFDKHPN